MPEKYSDVLKNNLGPNDKEQQSWEGEYDGKNGWIVLSNQKVLFIEEHGFLKKSASLMLNDNYKDISNVESKEGQLELTKKDGTKHILRTPLPFIIKARIEDLRR